MALIPWRPRDLWWNPQNDLDAIQKQMGNLFNFPFARYPEEDTGLLEGIWNPAMDIYDSKDNIIVRVDIPGMKKEDIDISIHGSTLMIRGEKKESRDAKEEEYVRSERFYGSFNRAVSLPVPVDTAKVEAGYKNGVLELTLPKKEESKPKQLKINVK